MKLSILLLALSLAGCDVFSKQEEDPPRDIAAEIQTHMQSFVSEAAARGLDLAADVAALQVMVEDEIIYEGSSICGFAPWYDDPDAQSPIVSFAGNDQCWLGVTEQDNEVLVFHELGHMILDRWHKDDLLPNNSRASLMISTNLRSLYVGNASNRRSYYIDELFDPNTPVPSWGQ